MGFAKFMSSWTGRIIRIVAGIALIAAGLWLVEGVLAIVVVVVGLVVLAAGAANFCIFAPLFGGPLLGKDVR